jgi:dipeptidyl aminopeptidase/acylaminoacyl peptidase
VQVTAVLVAAVALAASAPAPLPHGLLAFSGNCETCPPAGEGAALFTLRPDGRTLQVAISNASDPRWSPNGRELVFSRATHGGTSTTGFSELWRSNANGSGLRRLTSRHTDTEADWSPNGQQLVFVRSDPDAAPAARSSLWTMRRDGSRQRLLLRARMGGPRDPEWSPDGRRIVFAASGDRIYEMGSNGRGLRRLRIRGRSPRSSPDGRLLAVVFGVRSRPIVNVLERKSGYVRTYLLGKSAVASGPLAWSADGRWLAYGQVRAVRDAIGGVSTTYDLWALRLRDGRRQVILRNMELDGLDWRRQ